MSIRDDEEFQRLMHGTKLYFASCAYYGTHFRESKNYQENLIKYIDKTIQDLGRKMCNACRDEIDPDDLQ